MALTQTMEKTVIRTRFAPSPTGYLHIGGLRTALYAYLYAKQQQGQFVVRIEDTDQSRLVVGATEALIENLEQFGITPDESPQHGGQYGPYTQSERLDIYRQHVQQLLDSGHAYYCFCSPERLTALRDQQRADGQPPMYDGHCRDLPTDEVQQKLAAGQPHVVRLKVPTDGVTEFTDAVWGDISVQNNTIDDQVLLKADGFPTYHLAVVVDDHLMEISHVFRGEDWLPSTPKHVLLYQAFGWEMPTFVHLPNILNEQRRKLSKRQGDVTVSDFLTQGYLPAALLNFIALLGWHPGSGQTEEVFSLEQLIEQFSIDSIHKAGAVFDRQKLDWMNGQYLRQVPFAQLVGDIRQHLAPLLADGQYDDAYLEQVFELEKERIKTLAALPEAVDYFFTAEPLDYPTERLVWKKSDAAGAQAMLEQVAAVLAGIDDWTAETIETTVRQWITDHDYGNGDVLWPLRVALTGRDKSPGPFEVAAVLGKERSLERVQQAVEKLA